MTIMILIGECFLVFELFLWFSPPGSIFATLDNMKRKLLINFLPMSIAESNLTLDHGLIQPRSSQQAFSNIPPIRGLKSPKINLRSKNIKLNDGLSSISHKDLKNFKLPKNVHFEGTPPNNQTDRTKSSKKEEYQNIIKEQAETISKLKTRVRDLETELENKNEIIKEKEERLTSKTQTIQVQRYRDDLEIAHIVPRLRLCLQVFENNLQEYLFESKTTMTKNEFLASLIEKLHIEKNEDALLIANYFISGDVDTIKTWKVLEKIIHIAGPYKPYKDSDFIKLKETFENADEHKKSTFIKRLNMLTNGDAEHMTSKNFTLFLQATDINFDKRAFIVLLLRKSQSISYISVFALKQVMYQLLNFGEKPQKPEKKPEPESNNEGISNDAFVDRIKRIIVAHKVSKAFQARKRAKSKAPKHKRTLIKQVKEGIQDKIKNFMKRETAEAVASVIDSKSPRK